MEQLLSRLFLLFLIMAVLVIVEVFVVEKVLFELYLPPDHHHITGILNSYSITTNGDNNKETKIINEKKEKIVLSNSVASINEIEKYEPIKPLEQILKEADVILRKEEKQKLPTVEDVHKLYGSGPRIIGLETCQEYRDAVPVAERLVGPAGMFNSGTNLIEQSLMNNCHIPERMKKYGYQSTGMRLQPPWGKHNPQSTYRGKHQALRASKVNYEVFLPIVAIKDPYTWMSSMCRHHYSAHWDYSRISCPNLVPKSKANLYHEKNKTNINPVKLIYNANDMQKGTVHYDSLVHLWSDWYNDYLNATYPRLIVRYEDLLFNLEPIINTICKCAGGKMDKKKTGKFVTEADAAKNEPIHKGSSGLKEASQ